MLWLKRILWLAAWSVWLWLGFGLYRELPRGFGLALCQVPVEHAKILGYVGDSNVLAIASPPRAGERGQQVRLYDAESGSEIGARPMPVPKDMFRLGRYDQSAESSSQQVRRGVLFGNQRQVNSPIGGLGVLDLLSGEWRQIFDRPARCLAFHPFKPWVAVLEGAHVYRITRVVVFDWQTGAAIFSYRMPRAETISDTPFFLADRDQVVLPLTSPTFEEGVWEGWMEVRSVGSASSLEQVVDGITGRHGHPSRLVASLNGRLLFEGDVHGLANEDKLWMDVYDFRERQLVSTKPRNTSLKRSFYSHRVRPTIAPSGRAVLREESDARSKPATMTTWSELVEVGTGAMLWQSSRAETIEKATSEAFLVREEWHKFWEGWLPNLKCETRAWRSLDDGRVLFRMTKDAGFDLDLCNASRSLVVTSDGIVRRFPLPMNWPLLALCQAILALPLVLLWAVLRWRRRRAARREPAVVFSPAVQP